MLCFLHLCPAGLIQTDVRGEVRMINPQAAQFLMPLTRSPKLTNLFTVLDHYCPELRNLVTDFGAPSGKICHGHRIFLGPAAPGPRVLSCSLLKITADCIVAVLQDVTREVDQERQLRQSEAMFAALTAGVNDFALFTLDRNGLIDSWNKSAVRLTQYVIEDVLGRDLDVLSHRDGPKADTAAEQLVAVVREGWSLREVACCRRDGSRFWCQMLVAAIEGLSGTIENYSVVMRDVTERRMTGDEMRRLLTTDHLTGVANRARFFELAEIEGSRWARTGRPLSLIMLDVDHFKQVNDSYGHALGDALLQALARCCRTCLSEAATLARLGGEEFVVLLPGTTLAEALSIAESIRHAVSSELSRFEGLDVAVTVSLGCSQMTGEHPTVDGMLGAADVAMYGAKRAGRNRVAGPPPASHPQVSHPPASPEGHARRDGAAVAGV